MKRFVRFYLTGSPIVFYDLELSEGMPLMNIIAQLHTAGYIMNASFYIPQDSIKHACLVEVKEENLASFRPMVMQ